MMSGIICMLSSFFLFDYFKNVYRNSKIETVFFIFKIINSLADNNQTYQLWQFLLIYIVKIQFGIEVKQTKEIFNKFIEHLGSNEILILFAVSLKFMLGLKIKNLISVFTDKGHTFIFKNLHSQWKINNTESLNEL